MNKKNLISIIFSVSILIIAVLIFKFIGDEDTQNNSLSDIIADVGKKITGTKTVKYAEMDIVPTTDDIISDNSAWCPTFQLIWNDLKNEVVGQDIVFEEQIPMVDNLNKESFTADMLSEEYYYKIFGFKSLELKTEIEKGIKEKFNQESDILDSFEWSERVGTQNRYFFYSMLYREFEFENAFDRLDDGKFADYDDVKYMGIEYEHRSKLASQIQVLYYNNEDNFAVKLLTKNNDEVIFIKNPKGDTFGEVYDNMEKAAEKYDGSRRFEEDDFFKAPLVKLNSEREYTELQGKPFVAQNVGIAEILKAMQSIQFSVDEKGGKIKSEAGIEIIDSVSPSEPRYFYIDDTFALILKESDKDMPYFMSKITNIKDYQ